MLDTVNKRELAEKLAEKFDLTKKAANEEIQFLFDEISELLIDGKTVDISGFGKFTIKEKAEHTGLNPKTLETITIPAKKSITFKPAKNLKDKVNG